MSESVEMRSVAGRQYAAVGNNIDKLIFTGLGGNQVAAIAGYLAVLDVERFAVVNITCPSGVVTHDDMEQAIADNTEAVLADIDHRNDLKGLAIDGFGESGGASKMLLAAYKRRQILNKLWPVAPVGLMNEELGETITDRADKLRGLQKASVRIERDKWAKPGVAYIIPESSLDAPIDLSSLKKEIDASINFTVDTDKGQEVVAGLRQAGKLECLLVGVKDIVVPHDKLAMRYPGLVVPLEGYGHMSMATSIGCQLMAEVVEFSKAFQVAEDIAA